MKQMLVAVIAATLSVGAIAAGDAGAGKAKAAVCAGCHGMNGKAIPKQKQGTLLIFPSNLAHFVLPNKQDQYRVTISGNFWIKACAE